VTHRAFLDCRPVLRLLDCSQLDHAETLEARRLLALSCIALESGGRRRALRLRLDDHGDELSDDSELNVLLHSQFARHELLTSNAQVPYVFTFLDLSGLKAAIEDRLLWSVEAEEKKKVASAGRNPIAL
jgi:hypothetical protein